SCATIGSQTGSSNPSTTSSTTAAPPGTSSSINPGKSCPSERETGRTGSDQRALVSVAVWTGDTCPPILYTGHYALNGTLRPGMLSRVRMRWRSVQGTPAARNRVYRHIGGAPPSEHRSVLAVVLV